MFSRPFWRIARLACAAALVSAVLALGGCMAKSLAPAVDKQDRVVDGRLVGTWLTEDKESAVIESRDSDYVVSYTDKDGKLGSFDARLGRLGSRWVLDLSPQGSAVVAASDAYKALLLPAHTFLLFDSIGARIRVSGLKPDSLEAYLERQPTAVAHVKVEDDVVLSAPTAELRVFLERYVNRPGVLEPEVWTKR
jgi:hypothetical protein